MSNRFDGFTQREISRIWLALFDHEQESQAKDLPHVATETRSLINELYQSKHFAPRENAS